MGSLLRVANHLAESAKTKAGDDADAFGRTAFNRYYYAAFLTTRDLLIQIDKGWSRTPHANIPELLEADLLKRVRASVKKLETKGLLAHGRGQSLVSQAGGASGDIASILRIAYKVRLTADYEPEKRVAFSPSTFELATHTDTEAKNWLVRIEHGKGVLINVSKELGLV